MYVRHGGHILTTVYRKPTHTHRLLDRDSSHTRSQKEGAILSLIGRAFNICSPQYLEDELGLLKRVTLANGFAASTFSRLLGKVQTKMSQSNDIVITSRKQENEKPLLILPSDDRLLASCRGFSRRFGINIVSRPNRKLRNILVHPKDPLREVERQGVVYSIPFVDNSHYVGETGRLLHERIREHKRDTELARVDKSPVAEHVWKNEVQAEFGSCTILAQENNWYRRRVLEALWIRRQGTINRDCGLDGIAQFWRSD